MNKQDALNVAMSEITKLLKGQNVTPEIAMLTAIAQTLVAITYIMADIRDSLQAGDV